MPDPCKKKNTIYGPACPHRHHRLRTATSARTATSRTGHSSIPASWQAVTHWFSPPTWSAVLVSHIRRIVWGPLGIRHRCAAPSLNLYAPVGPTLGRSVRGIIVFGTDVAPPCQVYGPLLARRSVRGLVVFGTDVRPPSLNFYRAHPAPYPDGPFDNRRGPTAKELSEWVRPAVTGLPNRYYLGTLGQLHNLYLNTPSLMNVLAQVNKV